MHPGEIWNGTGLGARSLRLALLPLSGLYWLGWHGYLALYRLGLKKSKRPHPSVVVIGNLSVGGSGKSPATLEIARILREMGREVVVGCSGYGSPRAEAATVAPSGELDPAEWGDEPAMFRWLTPDLPLVVGRRRVLAAELVQIWRPRSVLLMDDGFQHLPLHKHLSLVIEQDAVPNGYCLPAGPYREPRGNVQRADAVLSPTPSGSNRSSRNGPVGFRLVREAQRLVTPDLEPVAVDRATAVCALGQPERFLDELRETLELVDPLVLPDHDPLTGGNLLSRLPPDLPIVVTAKDWVKLRQRPDAHTRRFVIALQKVRIEPEAEFRNWLISKLDAAQEAH
jgi:tetraacyldisaccharide 4'-kinase